MLTPLYCGFFHGLASILRIFGFSGGLPSSGLEDFCFFWGLARGWKPFVLWILPVLLVLGTLTYGSTQFVWIHLDLQTSSINRTPMGSGAFHFRGQPRITVPDGRHFLWLNLAGNRSKPQRPMSALPGGRVGTVWHGP